jgi:HEPN domain-containing protein
MSDIDAAKMLFRKALEDFRALRGMLDAQVFSDEIFGFHAQQAIEKALKAWLAYRDIEYPFVHDLSLLLELLEESGVDVSPYENLLDFNTYAVAMRYVEKETHSKPVDRMSTVQRIEPLMREISGFLDEPLLAM